MKPFLLILLLSALVSPLTAQQPAKPEKPVPLTEKEAAAYRAAREPEIAKEGKWLFLTVRKQFEDHCLCEAQKPVKAGEKNSLGEVKNVNSLDPKKELVTLLNIKGQVNGAVIGYHCFYPVPRLAEYSGSSGVYTRTIAEAAEVMLRAYRAERERLGLK